MPPCRPLARRALARHGLLATALTAQALAAHLVLPLVPVVKGLPFLALVLARPSGSTLLVGGAQVRDGDLGWPVLLAVAVAAALAVDTLSFLAGRWWGRAALDRMHSGHRHGRLAAARVARLEPWLARHGALVVLLGRPTLFTHGVVPVLAGGLGVRWRAFLPATVLGATWWAGLWIALGAALGRIVDRYAGPVLWSIAAAGLASALGWWSVCRSRPAAGTLGGRLCGTADALSG